MNKKIIWSVVIVAVIALIGFVYLGYWFNRNQIHGQGSILTAEEVKTFDSTKNVPEKIATPTDDTATSPFIVKKSDWGISFPLPSGWNVTNDIDSQVVLTQHSTGDRITLDYTVSYSYTDIDAKTGKITYSFNDVSKKWIAIENNTYSDNREISNDALPVFLIQQVTPVFPGTSRWKTYIIPLSKTQFLKVNITGSGQTLPLDEFIKTIIING